jgi:ABC-type antimicrobial peptide transport system permease subunit
LGYKWNDTDVLSLKVVGVISENDILWLGVGLPLMSKKVPVLVIPACPQWRNPDKVGSHFVRLYESSTAILIPEERTDMAQIQRAIYEELGLQENQGIARSMVDRVKAKQNARKSELTMIAIIAAITLFLGMTGLFLVQLILVERRLCELGVRLAVGASPGRLALGVLVESLILGGTALALSMMIGLGMQKLLAGSPEFFQFDAGVALQVLAMGSVLIFVSTMLPVFYVSRLSPVDLITRKDL